MIFIQNTIGTFFITFTFTGVWIQFVVRGAFTIADTLTLGVIKAIMRWTFAITYALTGFLIQFVIWWALAFADTSTVFGQFKIRRTFTLAYTFTFLFI